jgi:hypothetical protein
MTEIAARDALSDAIRYWEPRRILYNTVLLLVVAVTYWANLPASRASLNADSSPQVLFVLAVLANVAYCAAYAADVVAQISAYRDKWLRVRWMLLVIGVLFAGVLAHFFSGGLFAHST